MFNKGNRNLNCNANWKTKEPLNLKSSQIKPNYILFISKTTKLKPCLSLGIQNFLYLLFCLVVENSHLKQLQIHEFYIKWTHSSVLTNLFWPRLPYKSSPIPFSNCIKWFQKEKKSHFQSQSLHFYPSVFPFGHCPEHWFFFFPDIAPMMLESSCNWQRIRSCSAERKKNICSFTKRTTGYTKLMKRLQGMTAKTGVFS